MQPVVRSQGCQNRMYGVKVSRLDRRAGLRTYILSTQANGSIEDINDPQVLINYDNDIMSS